MSWYRSRGYGYGYGWGFPPKPTVAERKAKAAKMRKELEAGGRKLSPVELQGRTIARTFWGKAWCDNIESYRDYAYRLERGRSYVRSGNVIDLQIAEGRVDALVAGSDSTPYKVALRIDAADPAKWKALVGRALGRISSLLALTQGKVPEELLKDFCDPATGLFPAPREMKLSCSCPDIAGCCKHVAAVLYGIGARLDKAPELFFTLRSIDPKELVAEEADETITSGGPSEIAEDDLGSMFGIDLDTADDEPAAAPVPAVPSAESSPTRKRGRPPKAKSSATAKPASRKTPPKKTASAKAASKKPAAGKRPAGKAGSKKKPSSEKSSVKPKRAKGKRKKP